MTTTIEPPCASGRPGADIQLRNLAENPARPIQAVLTAEGR